MSYDCRLAAKWDPSVLGIRPDELDKMDTEERQAYLSSCLNRAADLLVETIVAFRTELAPNERDDLKSCSSKIIAIARKR